MFCEHKGQYYGQCCKQVMCDSCSCCSKPNKILIPLSVTQLCQRCDAVSSVRCQECNYHLCKLCFKDIHSIGRFTHHEGVPVQIHQQIIKQCNNILDLEKYVEEQNQSINSYFEQIQEVLDKKKKQLIDQIANFSKTQSTLLKQRLNVIDAAVKINSEQSVEIPMDLEFQGQQFNLTAKESIIESILNIDFINSVVSPRRMHTQQNSVRRSQSCRKLESQEKIVETCETFEKRKFYRQISQSNSIFLQWTHSQEKVDYMLELGIGMKIKGIEQFKQIYRGQEGNFTVIGLQPKTNYKFRVQANFEGKFSEFSDVLNIFTLPLQSIEESILVSKKMINNDIQVQFEKPGLILGTNPLNFGLFTWEIKLLINGIVEDLTASLVVGVANKQRRIIGTTLNYGYQREPLLIKVQVDMDNKCMTITSKMHPQGERFLINGPVYPAFQNKNTHKGSEIRKLNTYVDKEVLNLTGGLYPFAFFNQAKPVNHQKWVAENIKLTNPHISHIKTWVPDTERDKIFPGEKFNIDPELIEFTEADITLEEGWTFEETKYLFNELRHFNYNFIVLNDRYTYKDKNRDIYQLKERYYSVMREILQKRNQTSHQLFNYVYDEEYDRFRNLELEKYLKRTKSICEEEKKIQEELRRVDQQIKKQEKEHKSLTKCINIQENDVIVQQLQDLDEKQMNYIIEMGEKNEEVKKKTQERIVYLRNKWINEVLPIPGSVKDKLDKQLKELIPSYQKLVLNQEIEDLFCQLRKQQLAVLSQQRLQKRREQEKKILEEKIKKVKAQLDQQQSDIKNKKQ